MSGALTLPLTRGDRCDRCGAPAAVLVVVGGGGLLFCGHHFDEHEGALREVARVVVDTRG